ncbi:DUF3561 family protein [Klebsiella pneumoniae]|uniref:DUF3561 family protein n=1 Tax=Klebsiella pneumoniae TaxID=573 RepID=A0A927DWL4_KLEPN|nr:DUF3561 family protein [Klebsiella pneumoniae]
MPRTSVLFVQNRLRRSATRPPRSLSGAAVGFISWLLALGIPFLLYGSNTLFFLPLHRPFFLALMPVAVVVGIALHSLLNGKLLYSVSATILTVGLMFALLFLWLLG